MNIREELEQLEVKTLSPYAALSVKSKGRRQPEKLCEIRPVFQNDRDRVVHCKSFRRLKYKTQVFLAPTGDHYRTRLTHTLEVSQIARTIAKAFRLNEDLTEAIALAHDLGHTPFGHAGESVLNEIHPRGFRHWKQSLRVIDRLEKDGRGLNLSYEVRNGVVKHSKGGKSIFPETGRHKAATLEGVIVRISDCIAYINHDLDDALRAGVIRESDLPKEAVKLLGDSNSARINKMVTSVVKTSRMPEIRMEPEILEATEEIRTFLYDNVYYTKDNQGEFGKAAKLLRELYEYFLENPRKLPSWLYLDRKADRHRQVCDFIAGMTDRYLISLYEEIFMPKPWPVL
ncbi:MAG: deoxyguanosinetriphosphate triphosphohydrolase [bacterium]